MTPLAQKALLSLSILGLTALSTVQADTCGSVTYDPTQYTCTNGLLCPLGNLACGTAPNFACYNPSIYSCVNGVLVQGGTPSTTSSTKATTATTTAAGTTTAAAGATTTVTVTVTSGSTTAAPTTCIPYGQNKNNNFCLKFQDDFNTLDLNKWTHDTTLRGGGNWEFEWYTNNRSNSYVKNSVLYIRPTYTGDNIGNNNVLNGYTMNLWGSTYGVSCTDNGDYGCQRTSDGTHIINPIQSALLRSVNSYNFRYGKVEVVAQLPKGDWIWPAIWMLPKNSAYGNWPASGEIDIMESRGNDPSYQYGGRDKMGSTLHWGPDFFHNRYAKTHNEYKLPSGTFSDGFHTFGLLWTPDYIQTYVDDPANVILNVPLNDFWSKGQFENGINNPWAAGCNQAPFDQEFYLIMNVAVGGTNGYFPGGAPWSNTSPQAALDFWNARGSWQPSWTGEDVAMKIDKDPNMSMLGNDEGHWLIVVILQTMVIPQGPEKEL
ncbi:hypothetical protein HDU76_001283 [Blyttiomyces sp. JEL0837]|nr:hypothetical protein HDU76_001283 [Blyttiomyces sp. JEL0837]